MAGVYTYSEVARVLADESGVELDHRDVSGVVAWLNIPPRPFPSNGRAKGIDEDGLEKIRRARRESLAHAS